MMDVHLLFAAGLKNAFEHANPNVLELEVNAVSVDPKEASRHRP